MKRKALRAAFPYTVSIWVEFLFLGLSYGLLMRSMGLPIFYILAMSIFIFAGSMEFVTVNLLMGAFQPLNAFIMTLMVNARHLFYGLAMLGKYRDTGWKKGYLIFGMCDETFALNSAITPPRGWIGVGSTSSSPCSIKCTGCPAAHWAIWWAPPCPSTPRGWTLF